MLVMLVVIDTGRSKCINNTIMVITPPRPEIFLLQKNQYFIRAVMVDYIFYSTKYILVHDKWFVLSWLIISFITLQKI